MRWCRALPAVALLAVVAAGCGERAARQHGSADAADWEGVRTQAQGDSVQWWMFGGDDRVNRYVDEVVVPAAEELGVALERVPVSDTADAVQRVIAEARAGRTDDGSVDLIWINGENFALGKREGLWLQGWARKLPNADLVAWEEELIAEDFGVAVDGQESPWSLAVFVFAADRRRTPDPPGNFPELLEYARAHPGRITYPAPPDFTGSAFVRQAVQALGEDEAFALLERLKPLQWRDGDAFPGSEAELNRLFGNGVVDLAMSYAPDFVASEVRRGTFAPSTRPFVFSTGALQNTSYVTIPGNAADTAGALVVANLLLEPELQALKADPDGLGMPTVLELERLAAEDRKLFRERHESPYALEDFGRRLRELAPERVDELEARWKREVLR